MKNRISVHLANSKKLPEVSGVYRMLDSAEKCIYVGKAKNLRKRVPVCKMRASRVDSLLGNGANPPG